MIVTPWTLASIPRRHARHRGGRMSLRSHAPTTSGVIAPPQDAQCVRAVRIDTRQAIHRSMGRSLRSFALPQHTQRVAAKPAGGYAEPWGSPPAGAALLP